ncbi:hypothetical protein CRG98_050265 [Punica granatum]|uniref:Uncharacterized protein n=1 Tax=Punica granatum TaxID=22663 RepID=A0A2I0GKQ7_PUNGR|nr:hypothetical protein CRG98_050265 [Punica granatum]
MEASGSPIGGPIPESTEDSKSEIPGRFGVGSANRRPRPFHGGRRRPPWVSATSAEGSGSPVGDHNPESTGDLRLGVLSRFWVGAANRRPRPLHRGCQHPLWVPATLVEGSGSPIGGPDPSFPFDFL